MALKSPDSALIELHQPSSKTAADTLVSELADTLKPGVPGPDQWQMRLFTSLREVETVLDRLECAGTREREVLTVGPSLFMVRWR